MTNSFSDLNIPAFIFAFGFPLLIEGAVRENFIAFGYARCYGHGKSWLRAYKHYKSNWTFWQRLFWVPVFKENYDSVFRIQAHLSWIHYFLAILFYIFYLIFVYHYNAEITTPESKNWGILLLVMIFVFMGIVAIRIILHGYTIKHCKRRNGKK